MYKFVKCLEICGWILNRNFFFNEDVFIPQHKNISFMLDRESYNYVKSSVSDESSPKQGLTISFHKCNGRSYSPSGCGDFRYSVENSNQIQNLVSHLQATMPSSEPSYKPNTSILPARCFLNKKKSFQLVSFKIRTKPKRLKIQITFCMTSKSKWISLVVTIIMLTNSLPWLPLNVPYLNFVYSKVFISVKQLIITILHIYLWSNSSSLTYDTTKGSGKSDKTSLHYINSFHNQYSF